MKKLFPLWLAAALVLALTPDLSEAGDRGRGHHGSSAQRHHGSHGHFKGHHRGQHAHRHHHRFRHHHHHGLYSHFGLFIGAPFYWWDQYPRYRYYAPRGRVIEQPSTYVQREPVYWYYCRDPSGYYPYVQKCPTEWMQVVPRPPGQQ